MSYEDKILDGVDLLLKLHIHLVNAAFKYKRMTRVDDSMDDKPYEPNVSPYGTDKEQKAIFTALTPYIETNKKPVAIHFVTYLKLYYSYLLLPISTSISGSTPFLTLCSLR